MEDVVFPFIGPTTTINSTLGHGDQDEPQPKKRCIRFPSDLSSEDPLLISDSGFEEFSGQGPQNQHGDSFFRLTSTENELFVEDTNHPLCGSARTSVDTLSVHTSLSEAPDTEGEIANDEEENANGTLSSDTSDPCTSSAGSISEAYTPGGNRSSSEEENTWDCIFKNKEIASSPSKTLMMQRFISHLKSNPNDSQLQHFLSLLLSGPEFSQPRQRLRHVTNMADVTRLFRCSKKILVLTGAGISVSCGIPDFRSKDGLYSRVSKVFPHLRDPQSVFDIRLFRRDPRPFFLTAKELYPGQFEPSLSHKFIRKLESRGQLLRNYSQNIDTLENIAGIEKVTMCHGSFATATCIRCKYRVQADDIKEKVLAGEVPFCPNCSTPEETNQLKFPLEPQVPTASQIGIQRRGSFDENDDDDDELYPAPGDSFLIPPVLKPDIVFFGEDLPDEFHHNLELDKPECDLLLVIGSSLRVRPVSLIPGMLPPGVPQILINRESLGHCRFDIELLGNCDTIISQLCRSLGPDFKDLSAKSDLEQLDKISRSEIIGPEEVGDLDIPLVPQSENDIQALKECWKPKINENIADRLPENSFLSWRPRQYVFEGAEVLFDPDDDEDDDEDDSSDSSDSESSHSSVSSNDGRENEPQKTGISVPIIISGEPADTDKENIVLEIEKGTQGKSD